MELSDTAQWMQLVGRVLFAYLFVGSAIGHLTQSKAMAGYAASKGVPFAQASVFATGLMLAAGSLGMIFGVWIDLAALLLVLFLLPTAFIMHNYWTIDDPAARQGDMLHFNKDIALAGAALVICALTASMGSSLGFTLTDPLFNL